MKKSRLLLILTAIITTALTLILSVSAQNAGTEILYSAKTDKENTQIHSQTASDGKTYLFLPASADLTKINLHADVRYDTIIVSADKSVTANKGETFNLTAVFDDFNAQNGEYPVTVSFVPKTGKVTSVQIIIMKSANIKSLFLVSENPENKGREWVDTSKSNKAKGEMICLNADGSVFYEDEVTELKARGNSTFTDFTKKAYQIKIKNKFNLTGDENNAQKKWVLLANAADVTLIHNQLASTLAKDLGLPYTVDMEPIDLYYDGEYRGTYLLTDKVEVGEEGVDIQDLDGEIEDLNEGTDAYEDPVVVTKTTASKGFISAKTDSKGSYKYVKGLKEPELADGTKHHAYLLELEFIYRYPDEQSGFVTSRGQAVVTKNPEYLTRETGAFISQFYQDFEDAVFSPDGYNKKTGKYYYEYCDLDSLVKIYLINEYTKNYDSYRSSAFFYLPEDEDIMYAGPIWDYDLSFTTGYDFNSQLAGNPENFWAATKYLASTLITIESFRDAVKDYLNSEDGEFYLAASNMLGEDGNIMKFSQNVYASQKMNYKLWDITHDETAAFRCTDEETYENGIDFLLDFATKRLEWLSETTSEWNGDKYSSPKDGTKWDAESRYHTNIVTISAIKATCTTDGRTEGKYCADCGKVYKESKVIKATGHTWSAANCTKPKTCKNCKLTEGSALGHAYRIDPTDNNASETCIVYKCPYCLDEKHVTVVPKPKFEQGDVNMDGSVNALDARLTLRYSASLENLNEEQLLLADMNEDKKVNAIDARAVLRKSAKLN